MIIKIVILIFFSNVSLQIWSFRITYEVLMILTIKYWQIVFFIISKINQWIEGTNEVPCVESMFFDQRCIF